MILSLIIQKHNQNPWGGVFPENRQRLKSLIIFAKISISEFRLGSEYASVFNTIFKPLYRLFCILAIGNHCVKSVSIQSFSGSYCPEFGLNTERYSVSLRIQSERGKIRTRKTPNMDTIHAVSTTFEEQRDRILFYRGYFSFS